MSKELLLIDGHGLAFRGFYALPATLAAADGTPTNALVGFTNMLTKCLDEWGIDGVGLFFDPHGPTRRKEIYEDYKAGRKPAPEEFKTQMPLIIDISRLRLFITLKPKAERKASSDAVMQRLRGAVRAAAGINVFFQNVQNINIGTTFSRAQWQYTVQAVDFQELRAVAPKLEQEIRRIPGVRSAARKVIAYATDFLPSPSRASR